VHPARQQFPADQGADVIDVDAAHFRALVAAAAPLFGTALLAAGVVAPEIMRDLVMTGFNLI
jgi:hypothetical protein